MAEILTFYKLEEALSKDGCAICRLAQEGVEAFLDDLIYERVNDYGTRDAIIKAGGFCNRHAWQLVELGGALGIAIIYENLTQVAMKTIRSKSDGWEKAGLLRGRHKKNGEALRAALAPKAACPACVQERDVENLYLEALVSALSSDEIDHLLHPGNALCLPHFRQALRLPMSETAYRKLLDWEFSALEKIDGELKEFIRKNDYRFADEPMGREGDSWSRAVALINGEKKCPG